MSEWLSGPEPHPEHAKQLVDVLHVLAARQAPGVYDGEVLEGVRQNYVTKAQEDAISAAVTNTIQPLQEIEAEDGERRRTFIWKGLGYTALQVAESGLGYHKLPAALERVKVEIDEAKRSELLLRPGTAQSFISPRMTRFDAEYDAAKAEHLADEDALRTCTAVTNSRGEVVGRLTRSLLVRDIPLAAWIEMLGDPNNIFGKPIAITNTESALGVMKAFDQLDLPEQVLAEGPVTLIAAVEPYIRDVRAKLSVREQLDAFRQDQERLQEESERVADAWIEFSIAQAESLATGSMHENVRQFVMRHQSQWPSEVLAELRAHELPGGYYSMTIALAALIEQAWQKVHVGNLAIVVGDERSVKDMDPAVVERLRQNYEFIRVLERSGYEQAEIARLQAQHYRAVAVSGVQPGGGCSGVNLFKFDPDSNPGSEIDLLSRSEAEMAADGQSGITDSEDKIGKKKQGVCRIDGCPSRPSKTEVGGCDVCLKYCQRLFDSGKDPSKIYDIRGGAEEVSETPRTAAAIILERIFSRSEVKVDNSQKAQYSLAA